MPTFLDTNIVLYAYGDDDKGHIARTQLQKTPVISTQVINECSHVMRRKLLWTADQVESELNNLLILVNLHDVTLKHIRHAWKIAARYGFSHFDSLIIASALDCGCETLLSEDMQHGQCIENQLTLINPFAGLPKP